MTATKTTGVVDAARASYVTGHTDEARNLGYHVLSYLGNGKTYEVKGYADGSEGACSCDSYQFSRRTPKQCKHTIFLVELLEATEYERQAGRQTWEIQQDEMWFMRRDNLNPDERRALNAIRHVLRARGVRSLAAVARGRSATEELFGEAS